MSSINQTPQVEVKPTINVPGNKTPSSAEQGNFGQVVSWPIVQAFAVGLAAFGLTYAPLNYLSHHQVWVALSLSGNTQLAALIGIMTGCASCIIFFMLEEVGWLFRHAAERYGQIRNGLDLSEARRDIEGLIRLNQIAQDEIVALKRDNAVLKAQQAKVTKNGESPSWTPPSYEPAGQDVTYAEDMAEYLETHYPGLEPEPEPRADDGTLNEMAQARKILANAYQCGLISRGSCMDNQRMTRSEWQTGIDFLKLNGAVGETPPRGHELLVDAKQALDVMNDRMNYRAQHATGNFVPS